VDAARIMNVVLNWFGELKVPLGAKNSCSHPHRTGVIHLVSREH
jgi:hypothetical protein